METYGLHRWQPFGNPDSFRNRYGYFGFSNNHMKSLKVFLLFKLKSFYFFFFFPLPLPVGVVCMSAYLLII